MWFYPGDQLPADGTKFYSTNHHREGKKKKKKQSKSPENPNNTTWAEVCPSQKTTSTASNPEHETPQTQQSQGLHLSPCD